MKPAVFLDRDGVLNARKRTLVRRPDQLVLLPELAETTLAFNDAGYEVVIATNQEWVAHGYITREDHEAVMRAVIMEMERLGGRVTAAYACTHKKGSGCHDQKPKPGMLTDAARDHGLDLSRSWMVGDNAKDILAGKAAGCRTILVDPRFRTWWQRAAKHADHVTTDLSAARDLIVGARKAEARA